MLRDDFLPMGLSPYPSPQAYQLLGTPVGRALLDAAREALSTRWNMTPVGGEQKQALIDRTALLFVQQFGDKWQGSISADTVDGSELRTIVAFVSPTSDHKSALDILSAKATGSPLNPIVIGGVVLVGLVVVYAAFKKKSGSKAEAPFLAAGEGI